MFIRQDGKEADPEAALAAACEVVRRCDSLEITFWPLGICKDIPIAGSRNIAETAAIDLAQGAEAAIARMDGKARRMANQADRRGVTCSLATGADAVDVYYAILEASAKRWGLDRPTISRPLLESIKRHGEKDVEIWFARYENKPIAGALALFGANEMNFWSAAMYGEYATLRPSNALNVALIHRAADRGVRWYNLGSSSGLAGVERFKESLGAQPIQRTTLTVERGVYAAYRTVRAVLAHVHRDKEISPETVN